MSDGFGGFGDLSPLDTPPIVLRGRHGPVTVLAGTRFSGTEALPDGLTRIRFFGAPGDPFLDVHETWEECYAKFKTALDAPEQLKLMSPTLSLVSPGFAPLDETPVLQPPVVNPVCFTCSTCEHGTSMPATVTRHADDTVTITLSICAECVESDVPAFEAPSFTVPLFDATELCCQLAEAVGGSPPFEDA